MGMGSNADAQLFNEDDILSTMKTDKPLGHGAGASSEQSFSKIFEATSSQQAITLQSQGQGYSQPKVPKYGQYDSKRSYEETD